MIAAETGAIWNSREKRSRPAATCRVASACSASRSMLSSANEMSSVISSSSLTSVASKNPASPAASIRTPAIRPSRRSGSQASVPTPCAIARSRQGAERGSFG